MSDEITSVSWIERDTFLGRQTRRVWLRSDPPARAWRSSLGDHDIIDHRGHLHTNAVWLIVTLYETQHDTINSVDNALAPDLPLDIGASEEAISPDAEVPWNVSLVNIAGRTVTRYERTFLRFNFKVHEVILAECETRRLIRKEERQFELRGGELVSEAISEEYRYNEPAPKGTFEMPRWKPVKKFDIENAVADISDTLSESERAEIEKAISLSDNAWRVGDFEEFAAIWRFSHVPYLRSETDWRAKVEVQSGQWGSWQSTIITIRQTKHVAIPQSANSFQMISLKTPGFEVVVKIRAAWLDGKTWEGPARFTLVSTDAGLRIIQWDAPIEEIKVLKEQN